MPMAANAGAERVSRGFNTLQQVRSNTSKADRKVPYDEWQAEQIQRNGKVAGRLTVVRPDDWLGDEDNRKLQRKAHSLKLCSRQQWVQILPTGEIVPASVVHCHDRMCAMCAAARSRLWQGRVDQWTDGHKTRIDGNGKLKGNRTVDEIVAALNAELERIERTIADPAKRADALQRAWNRAGGEAETLHVQAFQHFITLTIPNVPHVWINGLGRDLLDGYILNPFRQMMAAIGRRARRKQGKKARTWKPSAIRRALWQADRTTRRGWAWKRPRGRHFLLGLAYLSRIRGYIAALEITHHVQTGYHPHLHVVTWGLRSYIGRGILRHVWRHYAQNEAITAVNVKRASPKTIGKELVKYITKVEKTVSHAAREIARALVGRRAIWTGGVAYGVKWSKSIAEAAKRTRLETPPSEPAHHEQCEWTNGVLSRRPLFDGELRPAKSPEQWQSALWVGPTGEKTTRTLAEHETDRLEVSEQATFRPREDHAAKETWKNITTDRPAWQAADAARERAETIRRRDKWDRYVAILLWGVCCPDEETFWHGLRVVV